MAQALVRSHGAPNALRAALLPARRAQLSTSPARLDDKPKGRGMFSALLHGSDEAKQQGDLDESSSHSTRVARGKYIHEVIKHHVKPGSTKEYRDKIGNLFEAMEGALEGRGHLIGSWESVVGELDTFFHIMEFDGYAGYDAAQPLISKVQHSKDYESDIAPLVASRSSQLCQEFAFWQTAKPQEKGGIYELRTYDLKPGSLLEWETEWRRGIDARRQFIEPIGAWFAQVGKLHTVHHMWRYPSMEARQKMREQAWTVETWARTVSKTVKLADRMQSNVLFPLPHSKISCIQMSSSLAAMRVADHRK